jgi:uncharacterized protein
MLGETDLEKLIRAMQPELNPGAYVFCTLNPQEVPAGLRPLGSFREKEGVTVILPQSQADQLGIPYPFIAAWITLNIHSALDAVGLTAAVSRALADAGISCNVVAAYYHDHLFIPFEAASKALEILRGLARSG